MKPLLLIFVFALGWTLRGLLQQREVFAFQPAIKPVEVQYYMPKRS